MVRSSQKLARSTYSVSKRTHSLEINAGLSGAVELPEAGDARAHAEAQLAPGRADLILVVGAWPRADHAHLAA